MSELSVSPPQMPKNYSTFQIPLFAKNLAYAEEVNTEVGLDMEIDAETRSRMEAYDVYRELTAVSEEIEQYRSINLQ